MSVTIDGVSETSLNVLEKMVLVKNQEIIPEDMGIVSATLEIIFSLYIVYLFESLNICCFVMLLSLSTFTNKDQWLSEVFSNK